ncbi:zinc ribbon domain-containing protein [Vibrio alfacsensis]|uniref:zinc ribbon domain-containing protein n=1 Tax=Vibrio alfacsensis TaxID=1074311 RepID=UPI0040678825
MAKNTLSVFKTSRFEVHNLSRTKRSKLIQTFKQSDMLYYKALAMCEDDARAILMIEEKNDRKDALSLVAKKLQRIVKPIPYGSALKASVIESVLAQITSFVELTLSGQDATYPSKLNTEFDRQDWLRILVESTSLDVEQEARDALARLDKSKYRPLTFEKYRISDGFMILADRHGRLFAFLNLWAARDRRATSLTMDMIDTRNDVQFNKSTKTGMLIPLSCSNTQREALKSGQAKRAILVLGKDDRLFLMVSVKFEIQKREPKYIMGIDRGIVEIATYAVRDSETGKVLAKGSFSGEVLRRHQRVMETKQKLSQKVGRNMIKGWSNYTTYLMHNVANEIVRIADQFQCQVVLEDLSNIKNGPKQKREKGRRKNNFRRMLSRQQYGRIEAMLDYKLQYVGLPKPVCVWANYTSITCPSCGSGDRENRYERSKYRCKDCSFEEHADLVGALNVAGSYICFEHIKSRLKKGQPRPDELKYHNWLRDNLEL